MLGQPLFFVLGWPFAHGSWLISAVSNWVWAALSCSAAPTLLGKLTDGEGFCTFLTEQPSPINAAIERNEIAISLVKERNNHTDDFIWKPVCVGHFLAFYARPHL